MVEPTIKGPIPGVPVIALGHEAAFKDCVVEEFFLIGTAVRYKHLGALLGDGKWQAVPAGTAAYTTRVIVIRPSNPARFNGTVFVEWLNVSAGRDSAPDAMLGHSEIVRSGYAYVGVSAQKVGIEGGQGRVEVAAQQQPLKKADPERYGELSHPGDAFSFDIYSQAGRVVRGAAGAKILGALTPKHVIAIGVSQSAFFLTTYVNVIDPLVKFYDGFLIHSRFGGAPSVEGESIFGESRPGVPAAVRLRTDLRVPVLTLITETDLVFGPRPGFIHARQSDSERLRIWEIAGAAHADTYLLKVAMIDSGTASIADLAAAYAPTDSPFGMKLAQPINSGPQHHYVLEAALRSLDRWVRDGTAPPAAARIKTTGDGKPDDPPKFDVDAHGIAKGGIRTPWVDVPTARLSGVGNSGGVLASMAGVTQPLDQATLDELYPQGKAEYLKKFSAALDSTIKAGFILAAARDEIMALADAMYPVRQ